MHLTSSLVLSSLENGLVNGIVTAIIPHCFSKQGSLSLKAIIISSVASTALSLGMSALIGDPKKESKEEVRRLFPGEETSRKAKNYRFYYCVNAAPLNVAKFAVSSLLTAFITPTKMPWAEKSIFCLIQGTIGFYHGELRSLTG